MQGRPSIAAVRRSPADDHHAFLAFSFEVSNSTEVLSIDGTHFRPVTLPGLVTDEASKLVTSAVGGWLVQATLRVRCLSLLGASVVDQRCSNILSTYSESCFRLQSHAFSNRQGCIMTLSRAQLAGDTWHVLPVG